MKKIIPAITLLLSFNLFALDFEASSPKKGHFVAKASGLVQVSAQHVLDVLIDTENTCESGCRYRAPSIERSVIVKKIDDSSFFSWTFVDEFMDSKYFSKMVREENAVRFMTPTKDDIRAMVTTEFKHDPIFYTRSGVWTVEETDAGTRVTFDLSMKTKKGIVARFKKKVIKGLQKNLIANFKNFQR